MGKVINPAAKKKTNVTVILDFAVPWSIWCTSFDPRGATTFSSLGPVEYKFYFRYIPLRGDTNFINNYCFVSTARYHGSTS